MDRQARTRDTSLTVVKSRDMQVGAKLGRAGWGYGGIKTTGNKINWPRWEQDRVGGGEIW